MEDRQSNEVFSATDAKRQGFQVKNVMKDDFGFEIPVETVPLPSGGRVYPVETGLHNVDKVEIRAMTAKEEVILTSRALIKKGTVITELIKSCLIDKRLDVDDMISGDRNALMTSIRITGYGSDYTAQCDCPACGETGKGEFSLLELPMKELQIDPVVEGANLFEFTLPVTNKKVHFKFLTGKDENEIQTILERRKKQGWGSDNLITTRLQHQLVAVDNIKDRNKITQFIKHMPAKDSLALRKYIDRNEPGVEMKSWYDCPACMESSEVRLPMGASFFWPDTE